MKWTSKWMSIFHFMRHCRASNKFEVSPHIKWGSVSR